MSAGNTRILSWARRSPLGGIVRALRKLMTSRGTRAGRRLLYTPVEIRRLRLDDANAAAAFAGRYLSLSPDFVSRRLRERWHTRGAAVGAFARSGRLIAFACLDDYEDEKLEIGGLWIRSVFVVPMARGLGIAQGLIVALSEADASLKVATVRAAIEHDNWPSLAAFARQGFARVSEAESTRLNLAWRARGSTRQWTIVEKRTAGRSLTPRD